MAPVIPLTRPTRREATLRSQLRATNAAIALAFADGDHEAVAELRTARKAIESRLRRIEDQRGAVVAEAVRVSEGAGELLAFIRPQRRREGLEDESGREIA